MDTSTALIGAIFVLAGLGVTGMGLPTVAIALLSSFLSPVAAASILLIPLLFTNIAQVMQGGFKTSLLRRLRYYLVAVIGATTVGAYLMANTAIPNGDVQIGCVLVVYALVTLTGVSLVVSSAMETVLSPLASATTGVITGMTGIFVIPGPLPPGLAARKRRDGASARIVLHRFHCWTLAGVDGQQSSGL